MKTNIAALALLAIPLFLTSSSCAPECVDFADCADKARAANEDFTCEAGVCKPGSPFPDAGSGGGGGTMGGGGGTTGGGTGGGTTGGGTGGGTTGGGGGATGGGGGAIGGGGGATGGGGGATGGGGGAVGGGGGAIGGGGGATGGGGGAIGGGGGSTNNTLPVNLGSAINFVILAKTAVSTVPTSAVTGNIGLSPAAASFITGFALASPPTTSTTSSQVTGLVFASDYNPPTPSNLTTAVGDMQTAFTDAAGRPAGVTELGAGDIGGRVLMPGVYSWSSGLNIPTNVTLTGSPTDVFIFQIAQNLTVANGTRVILAGGVLARNIFWQVSGSASLGTTSHFEGILLCMTAITMQTGSSINGRLLAQTAVNIQSATVVQPSGGTGTPTSPSGSYIASLSSAQAVPPSASTETGSGTFEVSPLADGGFNLAWNVSHTVAPTGGGIAGGIKSGWAGFEGTNVVVFPGFASPILASQGITPAQAADLAAGKMYVSITRMNEEIRGQIIPTGNRLWTAQLNTPTPGNTLGGAQFVVPTDGGMVSYFGTWTSDVVANAAHIHQGGAAGMSNSIVPLNVSLDGGFVSGTFTRAVLTAIDTDGGLYVNVHTVAEPLGAIRGQVVRH